ncbi:MAG: ABC transporter permease, partial [Cyclobacteriaceae bacterium]|nr:ABC transporter permease [Cyclobacteriaceae bacterium]
YLAYFILRGSLQDEQQKARISAIYNIFAFTALIPLLFILPRLTDSTHPGNGGNPGFNAYDLDQKMRYIFYPAVIGWTLLGVWLTSLKIRLHKIQLKQDDL